MQGPWYVAGSAQASEKSNRSPQPGTSEGDGVNFLFVDFNSYFVSCEQQITPELRGRPVAVVPMLTDSTCCIAASYPAKAFGVKTGTMVGEARRLCPGIVFIPAKHDLYIRYHHQLVKVVESVIPVEQVHSIDEMSCRLTGSQRKLEVAMELAYTIKKKIRQQVGEALTCSIGIAPNRLLAKVAGDMQKPDGLTTVTPDQIPTKFFSLKLDDFPGIGRNMLRRIYRAGIYDVPSLYKLSQEDMRRVWGGIVGERFWHMLRGEEIALPPTQTRSMGHQHVLPPEQRNMTAAYAVTAKLLAKASLRLRKKKFFARQLYLAVKFLDQGKHFKVERFHETQDTRVLMASLRRLWESLPQRGRPLRVGIVLANLVSSESHQLSLFEEAREEKLTHAVDHVNEKYGPQSLYWGILQDTFDSAPTRIAFSRIPELDEF